MKQYNLSGMLVGGAIAFWMIAVLSALALGLGADAFSWPLGVAMLIAIAGFSLCCAAYMEHAYQAATGEAMQCYFKRIHRS
ncbi:MAG: hypothetical protein Q4E65_01715 [Clostridia bacterium]|nr:hypothetical protein [Clostridia bacterium]